MSTVISLIEFLPNEQGDICEDASRTIERAFIMPEVLDELVQSHGTTIKSIPEEFGSHESSEYEFFGSDSISKIIEDLELRFFREVLDLASHLGNEEVGDEGAGSVRCLDNELVKESRIKIRAVLNAIALFELKRDEYGSLYAMVKVGR